MSSDLAPHDPLTSQPPSRLSSASARSRYAYQITLKGLRLIAHKEIPPDLVGQIIPWAYVSIFSSFISIRLPDRIDNIYFKYQEAHIFTLRRASERALKLAYSSRTFDIVAQRDFIRCRDDHRRLIATPILTLILLAIVAKGHLSQRLSVLSWFDLLIAVFFLMGIVCILVVICVSMLRSRMLLKRIRAVRVHLIGDRFNFEDSLGDTWSHQFSDLVNIRFRSRLAILHFSNNSTEVIDSGPLRPVLTMWRDEHFPHLSFKASLRRAAYWVVGLSQIAGILFAYLAYTGVIINPLPSPFLLYLAVSIGCPLMLTISFLNNPKTTAALGLWLSGWLSQGSYRRKRRKERLVHAGRVAS